jgi:hypothetical protein
MSREDVVKILKENAKYFDEPEIPVVEILLDDAVIHRTKKLAKGQRLFAAFVEDLKKVKE